MEPDHENPALQDTSSLQLDVDLDIQAIQNSGQQPGQSHSSSPFGQAFNGGAPHSGAHAEHQHQHQACPSIDLQRSSSLFLRNLHQSKLEVFAFGRGDMGQLGLGEDYTEDCYQPTPIPALSGKDIVNTAAGAYHSAAITADGEMYVWGLASEGQCCKRNTEMLTTPRRVEALENFRIGLSACGASHTIAVSEDGSVFACGVSEYGQLGLDNLSPEQTKVELPKVVKGLKDARVARVAAGGNHTLALTTRGKVFSFGDPSFGALGREASPQTLSNVPVALPLWPVGVVQVSAGDAHSAVLTSTHQVLTWGRGRSGQLGLSDFNNRSSPETVRLLTGTAIKQISCGSDHTLAITTTGSVYAWGSGKWGQTGLAHYDNVCAPAKIGGGLTEPVLQVSGGGRHSLFLTTSRKVFACGSNESGQLGFHKDQETGIDGGTGDNSQDIKNTNTVAVVQLVRGLPQSAVPLFVCAGGDHSLITAKLMTQQEKEDTTEKSERSFPSENRAKDLVYGDKWQPLLVPSFDDLLVTWFKAIDVLNAFTVGAVGDVFERIFACPAFLIEAFCSPRSQADVDFFHKVATKGGRSEKEDVEQNSGNPTPMDVDARANDGENTSDTSSVRAAAAAAAGTSTEKYLVRGFEDKPPTLDTEMWRLMWNVISSLADSEDRLGSLSALFFSQIYSLLDATESYLKGLSVTTSAGTTNTVSPQPGLPLLIPLAPCCRPLAAPFFSTDNTLRSSSEINRTDPILSWLPHLLYILLLNPITGPGPPRVIILRVAGLIAQNIPFSKRGPVRKVLQDQLAALPAKVFRECCRIIQSHITDLVEDGLLPVARKEIMLLGVLLDVFRQANEDANGKVPYSEFNNAALSKEADLQAEYNAWAAQRQRDGNKLASFCQLPFFFTPEAKSKILHGEAMLQRQHHMSVHAVQAFFQGQNPGDAGYLHLRIRRTHLLEDALNALVYSADDLKKPMRVTFYSGDVPEPAHDAGGVTKEFFQLLSRDLFREEFGMLKYNEATRDYWFNPASLESETEFALVGALIGLAIYNAVLLDIRLPLVVYKKLIQQVLTFKDLKESFPELGHGLQALLDYSPAEEVENVFNLTFTAEYEFYGQVQTVDLKPGGADLPVTGANRQEYVDCYTKWYLEDSIKQQFTAFRQGFIKICGGPALTMFTAEELELLVCGLPHLDFEALEGAAKYEGGYTAHSAAVRWFWEIIHSFDLEKKMQFLRFTTGSDRAPVGGLGSLSVCIQRAGPDSNKLPTSHTCFNVFLLPEYSSKEKMQGMLLTAIMNAQGFGLE